MLSTFDHANQATAAAEDEFKNSESNFTYDTQNYTKYLAARKIIKVSASDKVWFTDIKKGSCLGKAVIRAYFLVPKKAAANGYYVNTMVYECQMIPYTVSSEVSGMSQYASVGIRLGTEANRVCSPQALNTTTASITGGTASGTWSNTTTASVGFNLSSQALASVRIGSSAANTSGWTNTVSYSMSYEYSSVGLIQKNDDAGYAKWNYDYYAKQKPVDSYLYSTTYTTGMVSYNRGGNASVAGKTVKISYDIEFGAGYERGGKQWQVITKNSKRELGIESGTCSLSFY